MQLAELRTFLAIVETRSLVKASQQLNVTQSTVTARLKSLESQLGQKLINRQKSGATLTAAGERLRRYAQTMTNLWSQAKQVTALPDALSSVCNFACHPDLWQTRGRHFTDYIRTTLPQVAISVWHGSDAEIHKWLDDGMCDVILSFMPNALNGQSLRELERQKIILVSTNKEASARFDPGYIFVEAGEEFGKAHAEAYCDADTARLSFGNAQLGLEFLLTNGGSAYLPEELVTDYIEDSLLFRLADAPEFEREVYMVTNRSATNQWPWFENLPLKLTSPARPITP